MMARVGGFILLFLLSPLVLLAILALPFLIAFARVDRAKPALRAWDHMANAGLFAGSPYESLSSHAWRERTRWWARVIIFVTDLFQKGHCQEANGHEQPVVDAIAAVKGGA